MQEGLVALGCRRRVAAEGAEIDPQRLLGEPAMQGRRQGQPALGAEIRYRLVPGELAVGQRYQQAILAVSLDEVGDLAVYPLGGGRLGRGEEDQVAGGGELFLNSLPQAGGRREAGRIEKDIEAANLPPRRADGLDYRTERPGHRLVAALAVRNEGIVENGVPGRDGGPGVISRPKGRGSVGHPGHDPLPFSEAAS